MGIHAELLKKNVSVENNGKHKSVQYGSGNALFKSQTFITHLSCSFIKVVSVPALILCDLKTHSMRFRDFPSFPISFCVICSQTELESDHYSSINSSSI